MKTKCMFISCILALIMSTAVWAQEAPTSPQNDATAGLVSAEPDQFMSTTDWGSVSFNKAFVYIDYTTGKNILDVGAAFKAGPVYIGSYYKGNFGTVLDNNNNQTVETKPELAQNSATGTFKNVEKKTTTGLKRDYEAEHTAAVLIGFRNMGFQVGYKRTGKDEFGKYYNGGSPSDEEVTHTKFDGKTRTTYDPKGFKNAAVHTPFVAFGMNIPVGKMTISPKAALEVTVDQSSKKDGNGTVLVNRYGVKTVETQVNKMGYTTTKDANGSQNSMHTAVTGKLGVGLALGDALNSSVNIGYDFTVNAYAKTYKDLSGGKHKIKGFYNIEIDEVKHEYNSGFNGKDVTTNTFKANMTEKSYFSNKLNPSYTMQKAFTDRLSLFAGVECPITVTIDNSVLTKENKTVTKTEYLNSSSVHRNKTVTVVNTAPTQTTKVTSVAVEPAAMAAITYAAIPNRLSFNLGTKIGFLKGTHTYTKISKSGVITKEETTTVYEKQGNYTVKSTTYGKEDAKESVDKKGTFTGVDAKVTAGLKWDITENFILDFVYTGFMGGKQLFAGDAVKIACTVKF